MLRSKVLFTISSFAFFLIVVIGCIWFYWQETVIQGTLVDVSSGKPIATAVVQAGSLETLSDQAGYFQLKLPTNRNIPLQINAPGYLPAAFTFDLPWYLKSGRLDVDLSPFGISLQVLDDWTDKPLAQATLEIEGVIYQTDDQGVANLNTVPLSFPILISISQPGYHSQQIKLTRLPQHSADLPLAVTLEPQILTGFVVTQETQQPLAGTQVKVGEKTLTTDADGRFFSFRTPLGVTISIPAQLTRQAVEVPYDGQAILKLDVPPRQLEVTVFDTLSGLPLAETQITIGSRTATTDQQGRIILSNVSITGQLQASRSGYLPQHTTYHVDHPVKVALVPHTIGGVVRDATTGQPLVHTQITLDGNALPLEENAFYQLIQLDRNREARFRLAGYRPASLKMASDSTNAPPNLQTLNLTTQPCKAEIKVTVSTCLDILLQPFQAKAIYIPFSLLSDPTQIRTIFDMVDQTEINAIIIDVKSDRGYLAWDSQVVQADLLEVDGQRIGWMTLDTLVQEAKARNIYTIARMVIFKDNPLAFGNPALAVTDGVGNVWIDGEGLAWANPYRPEVWDYNIALAQEVAAFGFDEINLDYIRFPSDGNIAAITLPEDPAPFEPTSRAEARTTAIRTFISTMRQSLSTYNPFLSADVFGLTVWVNPEDDMNIGQRIIDIAPYVDYLAPMIYPSTFAPGSMGLANPSDQPYEVIYLSQQAAMQRVAAPTQVRPWLQGYWYTLDEMKLQKQASEDANSAGWAWWNAAGVYDIDVFEPY